VVQDVQDWKGDAMFVNSSDVVVYREGWSQIASRDLIFEGRDKSR